MCLLKYCEMRMEIRRAGYLSSTHDYQMVASFSSSASLVTHIVQGVQNEISKFYWVEVAVLQLDAGGVCQPDDFASQHVAKDFTKCLSLESFWMFVQATISERIKEMPQVVGEPGCVWREGWSALPAQTWVVITTTKVRHARCAHLFLLVSPRMVAGLLPANDRTKCGLLSNSSNKWEIKSSLEMTI